MIGADRRPLRKRLDDERVIPVIAHVGGRRGVGPRPAVASQHFGAAPSAAGRDAPHPREPPPFEVGPDEAERLADARAHQHRRRLSGQARHGHGRPEVVEPAAASVGGVPGRIPRRVERQFIPKFHRVADEAADHVVAWGHGLALEAEHRLCMHPHRHVVVQTVPFDHMFAGRERRFRDQVPYAVAVEVIQNQCYQGRLFELEVNRDRRRVLRPSGKRRAHQKEHCREDDDLSISLVLDLSYHLAGSISRLP